MRALLAALVLLCSAVATAQTPRVETGTLASGDGTLDNGEFYETYTFQAYAGRPLHVVMVSPDVDTYLILTGDDISRPLATNDDCTLGDTSRSCITYTPTRDGELTIWVTTYARGETGGYRVARVEGTEPPDPNAPVVWVTPVALASDLPRYSTGEYYFEIKTFALAGDRVALRMASDAFDPFLVLRAPDGTEHANDDCSPNTREACIELVADQSGDWSIIMTSYAADETGEFLFGLGVNMPAGETPPLERIQTGVVTGATFGDPKND